MGNKKNGTECNDKIINEINYGVSRFYCGKSAREEKNTEENRPVRRRRRLTTRLAINQKKPRK